MRGRRRVVGRRGAAALVAAGVAAAGGGTAVALAANGAPGDLDPTFADGGVQIVGGATDTNDAALAQQPDGRIVVADRSRVVRLLPDGTPDRSFGALGVAGDFPAAFVNASGVAIDGQGRILVAGSYQPGGQYIATALLRLTPDGRLDESFGSGGVASVDVAPGQNESAVSVLVDRFGRYDVALYTADDSARRAGVLRLTASGQRDTSFSGDGFAPIPSTLRSVPDAIALDGTDVVASASEEPSGASPPAAVRVARIRDDGSLDPSFGTGGVARTPESPALLPQDLVVLDDHRVRVLADVSPETDPGASRAQLLGLTAAGAADAAVGAGGRRGYDLGPSGGTALTAMGRSGSTLGLAGVAALDLVAGRPRADRVVLRTDLDGVPDASFGIQGVAREAAAALAFPTALAFDGSGRILTAGWTAEPPTFDVVRTRIARYLGQATPPATTTQAAPPATTTVTTPASAVTTTQTTTVPVPGPVTTVTAPAAATASTTATTPPKPTAAAVIRLPSASRCVASKRVRVRVVAPAGLAVRRVTAQVGAAKARAVTPPVTLVLKGRARARVAVAVSARLADGTLLKRSVTYRLCGR